MIRQRILFGVNSIFAVQNLLPEILAAVLQKGFEVIVVAPRSPGTAGRPLRLPAGATLRLISMKREIAPFSDLWALWQLWSILTSARPVISNMSTPKMALIGGIASVLAGVPHRIYTLRGLRYETTRSWKRMLLIACERIACACAHQVICISRSVRDTVLRDRISPAGKAVLLGEKGSEGITIPAEASNDTVVAELREQLGIPAGDEIIGFVGRLSKDKGIHDLVKAFEILRKEGRSVRLLLLGDFESGDPVDQETAEFIRNDPNVHWLGYVPRPESYLRLMNVFVFPTYREGLPRVLMEAAAVGTPVVSTYSTGVIDIVQDGVSGLLVPPGDPAALARATGRLLADHVLAARMGKAARILMQEEFDNTVYLERLGTMLERLAQGPATPIDTNAQTGFYRSSQ